MILTSSHKLSRRTVGFMIVIWLLCQSMIVCAGMLGSDISQNTSNKGTSGGNVLHHETHEESFNHHGSSKHAVTSGDVSQIHDHNVAAEDCCGDHENVLLNTISSTFAFFAIALIFVGLIRLVVVETRLTYNFKEPPPKCNYPRSHLVFCSFYE